MVLERGFPTEQAIVDIVSAIQSNMDNIYPWNFY